ncbi:MAG TPA: lactonase family protein [Devosiaceae bacterium]|jgi:6-phosphogluconolactonase
MFVYVGNSDFVGGATGGAPEDAVSVFDFNTETGALAHVQTLEGLRTPSYMTRNPKVPVLYVAERWVNADKSTPTPEQMRGDGVATLAIDPVTGKISLASRHTTGGQSPMHVNVNSSGSYLFAANPGRPKDPDPKEGHATAIRLGSDGLPTGIAGSVHFDGVQPVWRERPKTYPHSVFGDPDWKRLFVPQLMSDLVLIYDIDPNGKLTTAKQPFVQISSGAGPRHIAFHPSARFFYVVNSFDATLSVFSYDSVSGLAGIVQTVNVHPEGFTGKKNISHALVGPTGAFLYCSHRTNNSLAVYAINQETGELTLASRHDSNGARPRDFAFSPSGKLLVVANQKANEIASFHVNAETGALQPTGHRIETFSPNCVVFGPN